LPEIGGILALLPGKSSPSGDLFLVFFSDVPRIAMKARPFAAIIHILTTLFNHCL
jgi:hypothetical protein